MICIIQFILYIECRNYLISLCIYKHSSLRFLNSYACVQQDIFKNNRKRNWKKKHFAHFAYRILRLSPLFQTWFRLCSLKGVKSFKFFHLAMWKFYLFTELIHVQKYFLQEKYWTVTYSNGMRPREDLNSYNPCRFFCLYSCEKILHYIWKECISCVEVYRCRSASIHIAMSCKI